MENLVAFVTTSQNDLEKIAYQTSTLDYHRYFIIVGFEANRQYKYLKESDSFLEIGSLDTTNDEVLKRLVLVYSPPDYENIAFYKTNNIIILSELQSLFYDLYNGKLTKKEYLFSISRMNFVFENNVKETSYVNPIDYGEIVSKAMMGEAISFDDMKIALKELLPEYNLILDESCIFLNNDVKSIILEHNKSNYVPRLTVFYGQLKEQEKCIMIFDSDPEIQNYSTKIITIEGFAIYFRF